VTEPWPLDPAGWTSTTPAAVVPQPAAEADGLRGRRVVVGLPGLGWRGDLRADDPVVQSARTFVPILPEAEWYRAEVDGVDVYVPLVPIERVWVETVHTADAVDVSRLVSLDGPPRREPIPVLDAGPLTGRRIVTISDGLARRDLRAITELHVGADDTVCLRLCTERDWYRWAWTGIAPSTTASAVQHSWIE